MTMAAPIFQVTPLDISARSMNNLGDVVGAVIFGPPNFTSPAVLYSGGVYTDISHLGGGAAETFSSGINSAGQMTGSIVGANVPFLYSGGTLTNLGLLPGETSAFGQVINAAGQVAGTTNNAAQRGTFFYSGGTMIYLGFGFGDMNNLGQIVGSGLNGRAVLYSGGVTTDLGTLPSATTSTASAINNLGVIVGQSGSSMFRYQGGAMTPIVPTLAGTNFFPVAINDAGTIVGTYTDLASAVRSFVILSGVMYSLGDLVDPALAPVIGAQIVLDLNESNQILLGNGPPTRGYLLTLDPNSVPEPATMSLVAAGLGLVILRQRRGV